MLDKTKIKANFSASAPEYDQHAILQKTMANALFSRLTAYGSQLTTILDLGCGTGYLTDKLAKKFHKTKVIGIDIAPGMIKVAKQKYQRKNLNFRIMDGEKIAFKKRSFDLIVCNASLQWMAAGKIFRLAASLLRPGGRFVFNTFGPATLRELRASGFRVNNFPSTNELCQLASKRLHAVTLNSRVKKESFISVRELVVHLRSLGAQTVQAGESADALRAIKRYKQKFGRGKKVFASFEIISGNCMV